MTTTRKPKPLTRDQIRKGLDDIPMDTLLAGTASIGKHLTPKQREFARLVALGEGKAQAYRKSYNSKGKSKTAAQEGWKLSSRPDIAQTTEAFAEAQRFAESHTPAQLRAFVIQQLTAKAQNEDVPHATQVKCLELLGKVAEVGAFVDRKEVVNIKASGDIRSRIMDKLKLIGASTTIEHNAVQDDEQDADSLLHELTGTGFDAQDADPTHTGEPLNRGVDNDIGAHIIPHNRSQADSIPHIQSPSDPHIPHAIDAPFHDGDICDGVLSDSMCSPVSDDTPSAEADTGGENVTCTFTGENS